MDKVVAVAGMHIDLDDGITRKDQCFFCKYSLSVGTKQLARDVNVVTDQARGDAVVVACANDAQDAAWIDCSEFRGQVSASVQRLDIV